MKNIFIGAVLLSAQIFLVSTAPIVPEQETCVEGEPLAAQRQPDVNITILPSTEISPLSRVTVVCDADEARFPPGVPPAPTAPVNITIRFGVNNVKECKNNAGVFQCNYTIPNFFPGTPERVSCTAATKGGQCRFKIANITVKRATTTGITTPNGNVTSTTPPPSPPTPTGGLTTTGTPGVTTTEAIPPTPTATPTPTPTEDDDDSDSDDDSDDDDDDSDDSDSDSD